MEKRMVDGSMTLFTNESFRSAGRLLALRAHEDGLQGYTKVKAHPAVLGLLNLFLCGYFDHLMRASEGQHYLSIFLWLASLFTAVFFLGLFLRHTREVLEKSIPLPVSKTARFLYAWFDTARRPLFLAMYITYLFFFVIVTFGHWTSLAVIIALFFLMLLDIQLLLTAILVRGTWTSELGLILAAIVGGIAVLASSMLFGFDLFAGGVPPVGWVIAGMNAWGRETMGSLAAVFAGLTAIAAISVLIGIRRA